MKTYLTDSQRVAAEEVANNPDKYREELKAMLAPQGPPFIPLTASKLRELANAVRAKRGQPPLPEDQP